MTPEPARATYRDVFGIAEFRALFLAYVASILGDVVAAVALTVLVYERTHSPLLAALTFSLAFLPFLFVGTLLTSLVDRLPARRVLVACDLASAAVVGAMAIPGLPLAAVFALLLVLSLIGPLFSIVRAATLPEVLGAGPPFVLGRSLLRLVAQLAQVLGNAVGGLLLIAFAPRGVLLVDAGSFLLSAALLRFGTPDRPRRVARSDISVVRDSLGGLRRVFSLRPLRRLLLFGLARAGVHGSPGGAGRPLHALDRAPGERGRVLPDRPPRGCRRGRSGRCAVPALEPPAADRDSRCTPRLRAARSLPDQPRAGPGDRAPGRLGTRLLLLARSRPAAAGRRQ